MDSQHPLGMFQDEFARCREDIMYFISTYCKPGSSAEDFVITPWLKECIATYQEAHHGNVQGDRRVGKTSLIVCLILHQAIFSENSRIGYLSPFDWLERDLINQVSLTHGRLPEFLQIGISETRSKCIKFKNGSTLCPLERSLQYTNVFVDEKILNRKLQESRSTEEFLRVTSAKVFSIN